MQAISIFRKTTPIQDTSLGPSITNILLLDGTTSSIQGIGSIRYPKPNTWTYTSALHHV